MEIALQVHMYTVASGTYNLVSVASIHSRPWQIMPKNDLFMLCYIAEKQFYYAPTRAHYVPMNNIKR